jgi:hypothetical protein
MGTTPFPYDYSEQAARETYALAGGHTDLVMQHFDAGVPWPEAYGGQRFHVSVEADLDRRVAEKRPGQKMYLSMTPIAFGRDGLAPYLGERDNMERPGEWKARDFGDPEVAVAYTAFCERLIERLDPDYMAYGIEVNMLAEKNPAAFDEYVAFCGQVYPALKARHPDLPVFVTLHIDTYAGDKERQRQAIARLLPYTDYIAVSTYPFGAEADPANLPRDWFSQMRDLAPEKTFAVGETGFPAEDVDMPSYHAYINASEEWQAEYVSFLLSSSADLDAEFVVWFVPVDYEGMWKLLEAQGADELVKLWKDCGLWDGERKQRQALGVWDAWLALPVRGQPGAMR